MAAQDQHYTKGSMDISEHTRNWSGFVGFIKYSLVFIGLIMVYLPVFRTHG